MRRRERRDLEFGGPASGILMCNNEYTFVKSSSLDPSARASCYSRASRASVPLARVRLACSCAVPHCASRSRLPRDRARWCVKKVHPLPQSARPDRRTCRNRCSLCRVRTTVCHDRTLSRAQIRTRRSACHRSPTLLRRRPGCTGYRRPRCDRSSSCQTCSCRRNALRRW